MKKFWIQLFILTSVIIAAVYYSFGSNSTLNFSLLPNQTTEVTKLQVGQIVLDIELADNPSVRQKGLSGRESLAPNSGMLFIFDSVGQHKLWMKDMKIALDFVFIREGRVVDIIKNVPPPAAGTPDDQLPIYQPVVPVDSLLEVNAGFADAASIRVGDSASLISGQL